VTVNERIYIFLSRLVRDVRPVDMMMERSKDTTNRIFWETLQIFVKNFYDRYVTSRPFRPLRDYLQTRPPEMSARFRYFHDTVGATDGSYVPIRALAEDQDKYRNRKGVVAMNNLFTVHWDFTFAKVAAGFAGCRCDAGAYKEVIPGKTESYGQEIDNSLQRRQATLLDAVFRLTPTCLVPYRGVRYHLMEWQGSGQQTPESYKELYNLRHALLRNIVERIFGVMQEKFQILQKPLRCNLKGNRNGRRGARNYIQRYMMIVYACVALFNDMRFQGEITSADCVAAVLDFDQARNGNSNANYENDDDDEDDNVADLSAAGARRRDDLAMAMWGEYRHARSRTTEMNVLGDLYSSLFTQ